MFTSKLINFKEEINTCYLPGDLKYIYILLITNKPRIHIQNNKIHRI
jgi:hypothetical protein